MLNINKLIEPLQNKVNSNKDAFSLPSQILKKYAEHPDVEVETRLIRNDINLEMFKKLQDFMTTMPEYITLEKEIKSLDIYVMTSDKVNQSDPLSNLRFTLENGEISEYCKTDQLPNTYSLLYKAPLYWYNTDIAEEKLDTYDITKTHQFIKNITYSSKDINDIRLNAKIELEYDKTRSEFKTNSSGDFIAHHYNIANQKLKTYNSQIFNTLYKTYRLKHRYRYLFNFNNKSSSDDMSLLPANFYIDMTRVRSSKKNMDKTIPVLNFIDSEIAEQNESYEIEFEFIKTNPESLAYTIHHIIYPFIYQMLLPYAFNAPIQFVYSQAEMELVRREYTQQLNEIYKTVISYKLEIINKLLLMTSSEYIGTLYKIKGSYNQSLDIKIQTDIDIINEKYGYTHFSEYPELKKYSYFTRLLDDLRPYVFRKDTKNQNIFENKQFTHSNLFALTSFVFVLFYI